MARRIISGEHGAPQPDRPRRSDPPDEDLPAWRRSSQPAATPIPTLQSPAPSISAEISAERFAQAESGFLDHLGRVTGQIQQLRQALPELASSATAEARARREAILQRVQLQRAQAVAEARTAIEEAEGRARATIAELLATDGVAAASAPTEHLVCAPSPSVPALVRYGTFGPDAVQGIPAVAPLLNTSGWYLRGDRETSENLVLTTLVRLVALVPLRHLSIEVFDPRLRGVMGRLGALRNSVGSNFPSACSDPQAFAARLAVVMDSAARNVELAMSAGTSTLTEMWADQGVPDGKLNLLVVLDYPYAVDQHLNDMLCRAASVRGPSGTALLVVHTGDAPANREVDPNALSAALHELTNAENAWTAPGAPLPAAADPVPSASVIQQVLSDAVTAVQSMKGPTIPLTEMIAAEIAEPWTGSSKEALDIVIGRERAGLLTLSLRTENPPHPNLLIGGAVGQGKSNLLLDIVYSLAARYSPSELELHLLDFKRGLEFKQFDADTDGTNWLPHAKVLCLESSPAFGVAVLRNLEAEMQRRSETFKSVGASSINLYREKTGQEMPRIVLIVDEFHVLFEGQESEVDAAVSHLTALAKQGRAYGIHLLLASQTTTGVQALAIKGDAIFAQFPLRMSLKNTVDESQAILSRGNKAAAELTYRGEVILNRNFGHDPEGSNVRGVAAYAEPEETRALQRRLWGLGHGAAPLVFLGSSFADYRHLERPAATGSPAPLPLWVGRPIDVGITVRAIGVTADVDQTVAVVGPNVRLAAAAIRSMLLSAAAPLRARGGQVVVLEGAEHDSDLRPIHDALDEFSAAGGKVRRIPRDEICDFLSTDLTSRLDQDGPAWLVVALGLQHVRGMDQRPIRPQSEVGSDWGLPFTNPDSGTPRGVLADAARSGGMAGVHLVAWWPNLRSLRTDLSSSDGVGYYITADLGREDMKELVGPLAPRIDGSPRLGLYQLNADAGLEVLVPFDPELSPEVIR